jgi:hypothetical protein
MQGNQSEPHIALPATNSLQQAQQGQHHHDGHLNTKAGHGTVGHGTDKQIVLYVASQGLNKAPAIDVRAAREI